MYSQDLDVERLIAHLYIPEETKNLEHNLVLNKIIKEVISYCTYEEKHFYNTPVTIKYY